MLSKTQNVGGWFVVVSHSVFINLVLTVTMWASFLVWWEYGIETLDDAFIHSSPSAIADYVYTWRWRLLEHISASARHVLIPLPIGIALGAFTGMVLSMAKHVRLTVFLNLGLLWAVPKLAVSQWMDAFIDSEELNIYVFNFYIAAVVGGFINFLGARSVQIGNKEINRDITDAANEFFAGWYERLVRYVMPLTLPYVFASAYLASGSMWPLLIFSESIVNTEARGLGVLTFLSGDQDLQLEAFYAGAALITACSLLTWLVIRFVSNKVLIE